jgi:SPP1 Gp6-like portal protein
VATTSRIERTEPDRIPRLSNHPVLSPMWWVTRLYYDLTARIEVINKYDDYYTGNFPLPWLAPEAQDEFRRILAMSRANYTGLVVDAQAEREVVEGFRIDTGEDGSSKKITPTTGVSKRSGFVSSKTMGEADQDTWRIWQSNNMDALFDQGILESTINGQSYLLIAPNQKDPGTPKMWVEHPSQCIVEFVPGSNRTEVAAGLKVWDDDWTQEIHATLYVVENGSLALYKFKAKRPTTHSAIQPNKWEPRTVVGEDWPAAGELDYVPIWELPNNPRMLTGGRSEISDVCDIQDRIIKTIADRLMTQDYGAFPQKWASGWPDTDVDGNATRKIKIGRDRLLTTDAAETRFGQFSAAALDGYLKGKKEDVHDMAARTRTPAQYLLGEFSNVNGETLKASESGLVAKVRQRMRSLDDPLESALRKVREMAGKSVPADVQMEIIWRNPEFRTEGELVDALVKMSTLGVPQEALWERWGASPQEIARWQEMNEKAAADAARMDATALLADSYRKTATGGAGGPAGGPAAGDTGQAVVKPRGGAQKG